MPCLRSRRGQGLVEYIVLICLIAVVVFAIVKQLGNTTKAKFQKADATISQL